MTLINQCNLGDCLDVMRGMPDQLKWHREWNGGTLAIVDSPEAALRVLGVMAPESENRNQRELTSAL